ncbi:MAG: hypothetical protein ABI759_28590 [Candidatus Solibacter sp.]
MSKDRRSALILSTTLNGIDFVEIAADDQKTLRVHFLNAVDLTGTFADDHLTITGGDSIPTVKPLPIDNVADWSFDGDGNCILTLRVPAPGDFSVYTLAIDSPKLDSPFFSQARFSFKARCDTPLDCQAQPPNCPGPLGGLPPIDYTAKDFLSFKKALSDFSALRYPDWVERSEADFGVMMMEALSAIGDDLSYIQDRVAAESALETATQRRSLVRMARLVDYEPAPATSARVMLQLEMANPSLVPAGTLVSAAGPDATSIFFEIGEGLDDATKYPADSLWNQLKPYFFDDSVRCLKAGSTTMWIEGHGFGLQPDQLLLVETEAATTADPALRQIVQLDANFPAVEDVDDIFGTQITKLTWRSEDALTQDRDLTKTVLKGNLVPATQGRRATESFGIEAPPAVFGQMPLAVYRTGPNEAPVYSYSLLRSAPPSPLAGTPAGDVGLAWLASKTVGARPRPEIQIEEQRIGDDPLTWKWQRWLLDADVFDPAFTIDPVHYTRLGTNSDRSTQMDYNGDQGDTVRFGDGVFGDIPAEDAVFVVTYRVGGGRAGNVAPDTVWRVESPTVPVKSVHNPFAGQGGQDAETALNIRRQAPEEFRAIQYRAVLRQDYETIAQHLAWVQRAGTVFRWTGSWTTVFTTPDPKDSTKVADDSRVELIQLLNRSRLAGYESYVPSPRYAALDLEVTVCARSDSFRGDVQAAVLLALSMQERPDGTKEFFHPDNFTFGQPLDRSKLEAAIQNAQGVGGVVSIRYRRRGFTKGYVTLPMLVPVGQNEIILVENNPSRPENGSLLVIVEGGK